MRIIADYIDYFLIDNAKYLCTAARTLKSINHYTMAPLNTAEYAVAANVPVGALHARVSYVRSCMMEIMSKSTHNMGLSEFAVSQKH